MGLLDDAIRDHFELKRRHGADPGEVERLEHEALGPARREPLQPADGQALPFDAEDDDAAVVAEAPPRPSPLEDEDEDDDEGRPEPPPSTPAGEPEAPVAPPAETDQSTHQFAVEDLDTEEHPARRDVVPGEGDHDELEETPDFLQETPEHDRLWFEQKPPRDFDF
jgi:hypothetical protein